MTSVKCTYLSDDKGAVIACLLVMDVGLLGGRGAGHGVTSRQGWWGCVCKKWRPKVLGNWALNSKLLHYIPIKSKGTYIPTHPSYHDNHVKITAATMTTMHINPNFYPCYHDNHVHELQF